MPRRLVALLDANVLFSNQQRNLILQIADQEVISVAWTEAIEKEWLDNTESGIRERIRSHTLPLIRKHFPKASIEAFGQLAPIGRTDPKMLTWLRRQSRLPLLPADMEYRRFRRWRTLSTRRRRPDAGCADPISVDTAEEPAGDQSPDDKSKHHGDT
jgi:hypothetical protein